MEQINLPFNSPFLVASLLKGKDLTDMIIDCVLDNFTKPDQKVTFLFSGESLILRCSEEDDCMVCVAEVKL